MGNPLQLDTQKLGNPKKIGASTFPMVNVLFFEENAESAVNVPIANFCIEGIAQETWDLRPHTHIY